MQKLSVVFLLLFLSNCKTVPCCKNLVSKPEYQFTSMEEFIAYVNKNDTIEKLPIDFFVVNQIISHPDSIPKLFDRNSQYQISAVSWIRIHKTFNLDHGEERKVVLIETCKK